MLDGKCDCGCGPETCFYLINIRFQVGKKFLSKKNYESHLRWRCTVRSNRHRWRQVFARVCRRVSFEVGTLCCSVHWHGVYYHSILLLTYNLLRSVFSPSLINKMTKCSIKKIKIIIFFLKKFVPGPKRGTVLNMQAVHSSSHSDLTALQCFNRNRSSDIGSALKSLTPPLLKEQ